MSFARASVDVKSLVDGLNFAEKVERSLRLIREAYDEFGERLVVANSLGKDSCAVWDLAKRVSPKIRGFIVTTRYKPVETVRFMDQVVARYPELKVYRNPDADPGAPVRDQAGPVLRHSQGSAHPARHRGNGRGLLGDRPALHRRPHAGGLSGNRGARRRPHQAQPDPDLARARSLAIPGALSRAGQPALRPGIPFAGLRSMQ